MVLSISPVDQIIAEQRAFFATNQTKSIEFRRQQLKKLKAAIAQAQPDILAALKQDLNKPEFEGYFELAVIREIDYAIKKLKSWAKPQRVGIPLEQFPASAKIYPEPLGVVLIIGPWNYPFSLMVSPLIGAIAAGNCAVLKPSEIASATSAVFTQIIGETFPTEYITSIEGGIETSQQLLDQKFDHIFFTGGTRVGQIVMEAAARQLTPVTLELGGKSPCIVDTETELRETAKRIVWGKLINAGQTCIAPDYLLVDYKIKADLIAAMDECINEFLGEDPMDSPDYARIINSKQYERLCGLLDGKIITGGQTDADQRYIAPTLIDDVSVDDPIMQEEIFGPILPILEYRELEEAIAMINSRPKPLALYLFTKNRQKQQQVLDSTSSGGVCINDTVMHVSVNSLPFGGVGDSGIGSYHGKASFDTFSHSKSVLKKTFWPDFNWRYAPYKGKIGLLKRMLG